MRKAITITLDEKLLEKLQQDRNEKRIAVSQQIELALLQLGAIQ